MVWRPEICVGSAPGESDEFILSTGYIPAMLLEGLLTPVPKKDKQRSLPTNYRGLTVLSILGKVLEKVLQRRTEHLLTKKSIASSTWFYQETIVCECRPAYL